MFLPPSQLYPVSSQVKHSRGRPNVLASTMDMVGPFLQRMIVLLDSVLDRLLPQLSVALVH